MTVWPLLVAGAALSLERVSYVWIARHPGAFRSICARPAMRRLGGPVAAVRALFYGFKLLQLAVFAGWCYLYGSGSLAPVDPNPVAAALGIALVVVGQALNAIVFYRLGVVGVFYGDRFGYEVPWCRAFPFSVLAHPQYVGAVLSIWGVFIALRFPHADWIAIPAIETVYYIVSTHVEERRPSAVLQAGARAPANRRDQGVRKRISPM